MKLCIGDIVTSIAGRDIGQKYLIWKIEGRLFYLVNGKQRKISNPKKKKDIHVVFTKRDDQVLESMENKTTINDAYLRKVLSSDFK